jgi:hypothetical protein
MYPARYSDNEPPNIQATTPAMIQVTSDNASLTKPRLKLIKAEMAMIATIAQSTQVNGTVQPTDG